MEDTQGGLTDIEKRALRDLAENAGVGVVYIIDGEKRLSNEEALTLMEKIQKYLSTRQQMIR